ncbi:MAG TPA: MFS transporter [Acidobacteriota bacterium]
MNLFFFLLANFFWSLGLMMFFLLYNLHLTRLGFSTTLMGQVFAVGTVGTVLGSLFAGWATDRWGPKRVLTAAAATVAASLLWRAVAASLPWLLTSSFLTGMGISFWIVSVPPFLAAGNLSGSTSARFSSTYGLSIFTGAVAGIFGGYLPGWLGMPQSLAACGLICVLSVIFLSFIGIPAIAKAPVIQKPSQTVIAAAVREQRNFLIPLLAMVLVWDLLLGLFPPFFNVYFTQHHHLKISELGWLFSSAQFLQAGAVLSVPLWAGRLGFKRAISLSQFFCCPFFILLALATGPGLAATAYLAAASLQALTSPLIDQFMMANTMAAVRGQISGVKFFVSQGAVAVAAAFGGRWIETRGYSGLFAIASTLAIVSGALTLAIKYKNLHHKDTKDTKSDEGQAASGQP